MAEDGLSHIIFVMSPNLIISFIAPAPSYPLVYDTFPTSSKPNYTRPGTLAQFPRIPTEVLMPMRILPSVHNTVVPTLLPTGTLVNPVLVPPHEAVSYFHSYLRWIIHRPGTRRECRCIRDQSEDCLRILWEVQLRVGPP